MLGCRYTHSLWRMKQKVPTLGHSRGWPMFLIHVAAASRRLKSDQAHNHWVWNIKHHCPLLEQFGKRCFPIPIWCIQYTCLYVYIYIYTYYFHLYMSIQFYTYTYYIYIHNIHIYKSCIMIHNIHIYIYTSINNV